MKITFYPLNKASDVEYGTNLLETLLKNEIQVKSVCKGRGICATCQVKVKCNPMALSPRTPQETKTLSLIVGADENTRLACQSRIIGEGVMIEMPMSLYVESLDQLMDLIGEEAVSDYRHPVTGAIMIPKNKILTRSQLSLFKTLTEDINRISN
jgi:ferredoxin